MQYTVDAKGQKLGRLASEISQMLQGKLKADYEPRLAGKDRVVVKNITKIEVTGQKATGKIYYRHTGYMGHLKKLRYEQLFAKSPARVLYLAVKRMLPQNNLLQNRLNRLLIEK